ncbi:hypothetical protein LL912_13675 [Niabella sp. CC-SYL272]|uniref:hypothetical protein n=1 Tax=Niabella agricola TaxID=2891571 RepID=UPI001F4619DC|nr:hypothetical protein [Niabella agricola]MCF3109824.1 hypothetical protein [Niabella agricola]
MSTVFKKLLRDPLFWWQVLFYGFLAMHLKNDTEYVSSFVSTQIIQSALLGIAWFLFLKNVPLIAQSKKKAVNNKSDHAERPQKGSTITAVLFAMHYGMMHVVAFGWIYLSGRFTMPDAFMLGALVLTGFAYYFDNMRNYTNAGGGLSSVFLKPYFRIIVPLFVLLPLLDKAPESFLLGKALLDLLLYVLLNPRYRSMLKAALR